MHKRSVSLFTSFGLIAMLLLGFAARPTPAAADWAYDAVFWDAAGYNISDQGVVPPPGTITNSVYLNPDGGRTATDGLFVFVGGEGGDMVIRDRKWQVYSSFSFAGDQWLNPRLEWMLSADGACMRQGDRWCGNEQDLLGPMVQAVEFVSTVSMVQDGPDVWKARKVNVAEWNSRTYTLTLDYSYVPPSEFVAVNARIKVTPEYTGTMALYLNSDSMIDGIDKGVGSFETYKGRYVNVTYNGMYFGGIAQGDNRAFDSYMNGFYGCLYGTTTAKSCGENAEQWAIEWGTPESTFGPPFAEPYPMPAIENARESWDTIGNIDSGVGAHWDVTTNRVVDAFYVYGPIDAPPVEEEVVAECDLLPDMAVDPQYIYITAGGRAKVTVTVRNLCNDRPMRSTDLLFSLSDGMQVVGGSDGIVAIGQRGLVPAFTLDGGETRRWIFEVEAGASLPTAPVFVAELWQGSSAVRNINGVFITPAPAAAPAAPVEPVAPAAPAPLPAALPNTGGPLPLFWLPALAAGLAGAGAVLRSRNRR